MATFSTANPHLVNISSTNIRAVDPNFSALVPTAAIGPVKSPSVVGENIIVATPPTQTVATWTTMGKFDTGLQTALINFINTTKDGTVFASSPQGRIKTLTYYFYSSSANSVKPDAVGTFDLILSYPPGANSVANNTTTSTSSTLTGATAPNVTVGQGFTLTNT